MHLCVCVCVCVCVSVSLQADEGPIRRVWRKDQHGEW